MKFRHIPDGEVEVLHTSNITTTSERKQGLKILLIAGKWTTARDTQYCVWVGSLDSKSGDYVLSEGDYCDTEEQALFVYLRREGMYLRDKILGIM